MITKDNIQKVLLELKFISNHGVYTRHFGSADEGFDLEYNFNVGEFIYEPTLKSKACLKCLYFTIIIFDLCRYLEYFSYLCTINQTE